MEVQNTDTATSPLSCPKTVTVRRNPRRRVRDTPLTNIPLSFPKPTPVHRDHIPFFPVHEILSIDVDEQQKIEPVISDERLPENLKVYLRIRPVVIQNNAGKKVRAGAGTSQAKNVWPKNPREKITSERKLKMASKVCLVVNDSHSVTLVPPAKLQDNKRTKSEVYEGFSHVFSPEVSQREVYEKMVNPLVDDLLRGKSGMLAALGPSGSGKTHTIFGSGKDPGMVTLALRQLFSEENDGRIITSRIFHLSMFEISSEKGKAEKIFDLSLDGTDLCTQHTSIKGVQETKVSDIQQAESIISNGLLRRATAMTNSNSQSSRSQCIINIRCGHEKSNGEVGEHSNGSTLTIVDLAGAEREKKTGNQGARLLESNFINNTSMVFGQCLRSLLEHQKNPKKPLHKHFQNSMLTKYLRDYLEGKKRMALLITARSEEEDYIDTSFLLRQTSPYTKIKFDCTEEPVNLNCNKRLRQALPISNQHKRIKTGDIENCKSGGKKKKTDFLLSKEEHAVEGVEQNKLAKVLIGAKVNGSSSPIVCPSNTEEKDREYHILLGFSKAIWKVLKEYKKKLEVADNEIYSLRAELNELKDRHSSKSIATTMMSPPEDCQSVEAWKDNSGLSSCQLPSSEQSGNEQICHENDYENEACTLKHELKDDSKSPQSSQIISSAEMLSYTKDHCSVDIGEHHRVMSHKDPKFEDAIVEDSSLECEAHEIIVNSCQCTDQGNENHKERTSDSIHVEPDPTSNSPPSSHSLNEPHHDDKKSHVHTTSPKPEDVGKCNALEAVLKHTSCGFPRNAEKTKRTLQPASAILLKDIGSVIDFVDEIEKVKDFENEARTLKHELQDDSKSVQSSQIISSADMLSCTEDHCSVDIDEDHHVMSQEDSKLEDAIAEDSLECEAREIIVNSCQCSDQENENHKERTDSIHVEPEPTSNSPLSSHGLNEPHHDDKKRHVHTTSPKPEDVGKCNALEAVPKHTSCGFPRNAEKPKRRLLPASAILLKDIGSVVDFVDETEKVKGGKGEKKAATHAKKMNMSNGSLSLLRLLTNQTRL